MVYTISLKSGQFVGYYYYGNGESFNETPKYFNRRELSTHLIWAIKKAKLHDTEILIKEYKLEETNSFSVDSLEEFKTLKMRNDKIDELLNSD